MEFELFERTFKLLVEEKQWDKLRNIVEIYMLKNIYFWIAVLILVICIYFQAKIPKINSDFPCGYVTSVLYALFLLTIFVFCRKEGKYGIRKFSISYYITKTGFHEGNILIALFNVVMFIPMGVMLGRQLKNRRHIMFFFYLFCGAGIEWTQYLLSKGNFAIADICMYILGETIGYWMIRRCGD